MITAAQLGINVITNSSPAEAGLARLGAQAKGAQGAMRGVGMVALAAGVALVGIGVASVKMAGDFQQGITTLVTGAGESQKNIKMISDGILNLATTTGTSTQQLISGMYMIESAGFHGAQALDVLKAAAEGAKVGNADLGAVANGVTTIMVDYKDAHISAAEATNMLIATVANGKTHMQDLATAISGVLPAASAVKVHMLDVAAAMATMTGEGTDAASASTYLRQLLLALSAPAKQGAKALAAIGLTTQEVSADMKKSLPDTLATIMSHLARTYQVGSPQYIAALKAIAGGSRQMQGILELTGTHLMTLHDNMIAIGDASMKGQKGITGWNLVQQDFNFKLSRAKEVAETFIIKLGTGLLPIVGKLVDMFSSNFVPAITAVAGSFATNLGPALSSVGDFLGTGLGPLLTQLAGIFSSQIMPIVGAAAQVFATDILPAVTQFAQFISKNVVPIVANLIGVFRKDVMPTVQTVANLFWKQLLPPIENIASKILPILNPLLSILGAIFKNAVGPAVVITVKAIIGLVDAISWVVDKVSGFISILGQAKDFIGLGFTAAIHGISSTFQNVFSGLLGIVKGPINGILGGVNALIRALDSIQVTIPSWVPMVGGDTFGINIPQVPYLAKGGPVDPNKPYVVGDGGPELFIPNRRGTVVSNNVVRSAMQSSASTALSGGFSGGYGGGSSGGQKTIVVQIGSQQLMRIIMPELARTIRTQAAVRHM